MPQARTYKLSASRQNSAGNPRTGVAGRVADTIVGVRMDHNRSAVAVEDVILDLRTATAQIDSRRDRAGSRDQKIGQVAQMTSVIIVQTMSFV